MPARGRHLESTLRVLLALHLGEIDVVPGPVLEQPRHVHRGYRELGSPVEEVGDLRERRRAKHPEPGHDARLGQIFLRQDQRLDTRRARGQSHRERPAHRADCAFQAQLTQHGHRAKTLLRDLFRGGENTERDRQVECRAVLADVGRGRCYNARTRSR